MQDSVDTSASAASSGGSSSLPASSGDNAADTLRVDFYVLEEASSLTRLKVACRLAEKAYLAAQTALVWHTDPDELRAFDDLLWTFMDGSFVPHEILTPASAGEDSPVLLSPGLMPPRDIDIIINLASEVPSACLARTRRIAEIIDGDDSRRRAGRARFKTYRDLGIQPASIKITG